MFQVISRATTVSGNPSRLILVYSTQCMSMGEVIECCITQSSLPNRVRELKAQGLKQLPSMYIQAQEFKDLQAQYQSVLTHSH